MSSKKNKNKKSATKQSNIEDQCDIATEDPSESMDTDMIDDSQPTEAYVPGHSRPLGDDEELIMDKSAYRLFFDLQVESSSLSFDFIEDLLGSDRIVERDGPTINLCMVAGTQACSGNKNKLVVMRLDNLKPFRKKKSDSADEEEDSDDSESSEDDEEENLDNKPEVEAATLMHPGIVNRVRVKHHAGRCFAASWSDQGKVMAWDLTRPLNAVNDSAIMSEYTRRNESPHPVVTFKGHKSEGFALDWSPTPGASGHLASGDCRGSIFHWVPNSSGWTISPRPYAGHTSSVEDLQWSSTEPTVFISVSADSSLRVWDVRSGPGKGSMLTLPQAHDSDINVASWNRIDSTKLVTGGDDALVRLWDLRQLSNSQQQSQSTGQPPFLHSYKFHSKPITSIEWHPTDANVFAASAEDNQVTLWDSTVEAEEEEAVHNGDSNQVDDAMQVDANQVPVELLFIHSGQNEIKELHWHRQLPGLLVSTALDGFNVWRTCNV